VTAVRWLRGLQGPDGVCTGNPGMICNVIIEIVYKIICESTLDADAVVKFKKLQMPQSWTSELVIFLET
jgi:hypothetical protein